MNKTSWRLATVGWQRCAKYTPGCGGIQGSRGVVDDRQREIEVHLPDHVPTALANPLLLGTGHDNSIPSDGRYYKTSNNLPWAINIIEKLEYPIEKTEIPEAHLKFSEWAESGGAVFNDWYKATEGYRNDEKIYHPVNR